MPTYAMDSRHQQLNTRNSQICLPMKSGFCIQRSFSNAIVAGITLSDVEPNCIEEKAILSLTRFMNNPFFSFLYKSQHTYAVLSTLARRAAKPEYLRLFLNWSHHSLPYSVVTTQLIGSCDHSSSSPKGYESPSLNST